jgi:DNA polymerase-3 subunit gamma/tau
MSAIGSATARASAAPRPVPDARPQMMAPTPEAQSAPARKISSFPELVALAGEKRDLMTKSALETDVRLVRFEDGRLEIALERNAQRMLVNDLSRKLEQWTNRRWTVVVSNEAGQPTLREQSLVAKNERERTAEADPRVKEVLARFPGAKLVEVRRLAAEPPESGVSDAGLSDDGFVGEGPDDSDDDF